MAPVTSFSHVRKILASITISLSVLSAQAPSPRPSYLDQRFDENWSYLRDPALTLG